MKYIISSIFMLGLIIQARAAAPVVSNVYAVQRTGTKLVDITYDVTSSQTNLVTVSVIVSNSTGILSASHFSGHVGSGVATGTGRTIVWDGGADQNGQNLTGLKVYLSASAGDEPSPAGMVTIPAGSFMMGGTGASPVHPVELSAFYMDQTEVTKGEWDAVTAWAVTNGYNIGNGYGRATNHPAQKMQWISAVKWCNARSERAGLTPCYTNTAGTVIKTNTSFSGGCNWAANGYRLPTEAEWEYAARGTGASNIFPWTDSNEIQHTRANYWSTSAFTNDTSLTRGYHPTYITTNFPYTSPAGSFAPNAYGLYDMAGNVFEWVWDFYSSPYNTTQTNNPHGPSTGTARVIRGGSWGSANGADFSVLTCRVFTRNSSTGPTDYLGFRCVKNASLSDTVPVASSLFNADFRTVASVVLSGLSQTYSGLAKFAAASTAPTNLAVALTYNGSTNRPVNAGSYAVVGTVTDSGYIGSASGTLVIAKATLTVTANSTNKTYNTPNPTLTAAITGFVNGETASVVSGEPSLSTTATLTSNAGTYPITVTQGTLSAANYSFSFVAGTLTVLNSLSGFAVWASDKGLSDDPAVEFGLDRDNDGVPNGLEYALGTNFVAGTQKVLAIRIVNGRPVAEVPAQDVTTLPYVTVQVRGCAHGKPCPANVCWPIINPATDTTGKPDNRSWFEPQNSPVNVSLKLEAVPK